MSVGSSAMSRILSATIVAFTLVVAPACSRSPAAGSTIDTILFNGKIVTVDEAFSYGEAIALGNGKVVAVGSNDDIRRMAQSETRQIDLRGRTVVPGLIDSHIH